MPVTQRNSLALPRLRTGLGVAGWDRSWQCAPSGDSAGQEEVDASRPRSGGARVEGALELLGASESGEGLELSSLPSLAAGPHCQETFVVPRTAGGGAASPPSEEPEPQDVQGRAAALRTQFRWRFPGCSRALISGLLRPPSRPPARPRGPGPRRERFLLPSPRRGQ